MPARDHDRTRRLVEPGPAEYDEMCRRQAHGLLAPSSEDCEALPVLQVRSPGYLYGLTELSEPGSDRLIVGVRQTLKEGQGLLPAVTGGRGIADG